MLSFRKRLVLVHLATIVGVLIVTAFAAYWTLARQVHEQLDAALLALAETERGLLTETGGPVRVHEIAPDPGTPFFVRLDRLVQIVDGRGEVLARSANLGDARLPASPALLARLSAGETVFETLHRFGEEPVRLVSMPLKSADGAARAIQVAGSLDDVDHVVQAASLLFGVMGLALIAAVGTAGALLTKRAFRAIDEVVQQAHRIGQATLGARLPHPGTRDEIGRLVDTLNEMLGRIEHGFEAQRRFTADASHELRSPLSRLRTELELALRRPRDAADYVQTLRSCVDEVERLTLLVDELLVLARLDAGEERGPIESVSLNQLADEAVRRLDAVARERQVQLVVEPSPPVAARVARGAASLVLANLLDNALKFSPAGSRISISLGMQTRGDEPPSRAAVETSLHAVMRVRDGGPGIRHHEMPHLFERFYRGADARATEVPGVGLGLALSQAIVQTHGGRIEAASPPGGGAVFTVWLPLAA